MSPATISATRAAEARALLRELLRAAYALPAAPVARKVGANVLLSFRLRASVPTAPAGDAVARSAPNGLWTASLSPNNPHSSTTSAVAGPDDPIKGWLEDGRVALRVLTWLGSLSEAECVQLYSNFRGKQ